MKTSKGRIFSRLKVLGYSHTKDYKVYVDVECKCGTLFKVVEYSLISNNTKSCGCLLSETTAKRFTKHGMSPSKKTTGTYSSWHSMIQRCCKKKCKAYKDYGGRGIKVCKKWEKFTGFFKDMGAKPNGLSLDRIDNQKGYTKSNCRWTTKQQQARNTRRNVKYKGELAVDASKRLGGGRGMVSTRIKNGWTKQKAFTEPVDKSNFKGNKVLNQVWRNTQ